MSELPSLEQSGDSTRRATRLRDQALRLLQHAGGWLEIDGYPGRVRAYDDDQLFILHRTPFTPPPVSAAAEAAGIDAATQRQAAREYGLDIWRQSRKVMSLIWDEGKSLGVVMFKPGDWEADLARLASRYIL